VIALAINLARFRRGGNPPNAISRFEPLNRSRRESALASSQNQMERTHVRGYEVQGRAYLQMEKPSQMVVRLDRSRVTGLQGKFPPAKSLKKTLRFFGEDGDITAPLCNGLSVLNA
jgi:hypothetical protein